jgi:hypothetical protein
MIKLRTSFGKKGKVMDAFQSKMNGDWGTLSHIFKLQGFGLKFTGKGRLIWAEPLRRFTWERSYWNLIWRSQNRCVDKVERKMKVKLPFWHLIKLLCLKGDASSPLPCSFKLKTWTAAVGPENEMLKEKVLKVKYSQGSFARILKIALKWETFFSCNWIRAQTLALS